MEGGPHPATYNLLPEPLEHERRRVFFALVQLLLWCRPLPPGPPPLHILAGGLMQG